MAGVQVPISYPTNTVDLQKAIGILNQSKMATDQLRESTKKLGSETATSGKQVSSTLEGMNLKLQQLRGQIQNTSQANTAQLQKLSAEYKALQAEIDKTNKKLFEQESAWKGVFNAAKLIIAANIVREIGQIALSMATLKGNVEGVSNAFNKLPNAELLLNNIRKATHGAIDDFRLMQLALKAENFGVPLRQLGSLLEFAAVRSQQTGVSIDYLTESIITGIGRKSIKILDNLQINIADLNHRVKDLGITYGDAVGQIANEQLKLMGGYLETSKTHVEQLNAGLETTKQILSTKIETGWFARFLNEGVQGINNFLKGVKELNKETAASDVNRFLSANEKDLSDRQKVVSTIYNEIQRRKDLIQTLKDELFEVEKKVDFYVSKHDPAYNAEIDKLGDYRRAMEGRKDVLLASIPLLEKALNNQLQTISAEEKEIITLETMKERVSALREEYEKEVEFGDRTLYLAKAKQIRQIQEEIDRREELLSIKKLEHVADQQQADDLKINFEELEKLFKEWAKLDNAVIPTLDNIEEDSKEVTEEILTQWQEVFARLRIGWDETGKKARSSQEQAAEVIKEIKRTTFSIAESLFMAEVNAEVRAYDQRLSNARTYYDKLIDLAGDNERRKVELQIKRDNELKKLEKQKGEAETRAAKRRVYLESAMGVARAFADYSYPYSLIVAALVAGSALAQINEINKAPKGYKRGVIGLKGPGSETSDSIPAMLSRNESVITAQATRDSYKTLHKIQSGKLNDKVMEKIIAGSITVVGSDDKYTAKKLDELIKITKANRPPDYVERAGMLYRVKDKGSKSKQYIRSKYGF